MTVHVSSTSSPAVSVCFGDCRTPGRWSSSWLWPHRLAVSQQSNATSIATEIVRIGANGTPVLVGVVAVGGIIGGIASLSLHGRHSMSVPLAIGLFTCAFALCTLTVTSVKAVALALVSIAGIGVAYQVVCSRTLLQSSASGRSLDLLVGINALIGVSISGVSAFCAAELNAAIGVRGSLRVAAGLAVLGALYTLWRLRRSEQRSPTRREELDAVKKRGSVRGTVCCRSEPAGRRSRSCAGRRRRCHYPTR